MDRDLSTLETRNDEMRKLVSNTDREVISLVAQIFWTEQALLYAQ